MTNQLNFQALHYNITAIFKMCDFHKSKTDDDPLGSHMGLSLGYLRKALKMVDKTIDNSKQNKKFKKAMM